MSDLQPLGFGGSTSNLTRCPASHLRVKDGPAGAHHAMISEVIRSRGDVTIVNAAIRMLMTAAFLGATVAGCSVDRIAVNMIGNALSGSSVYSTDEDPELIRAQNGRIFPPPSVHYRRPRFCVYLGRVDGFCCHPLQILLMH